MTSLVTLSPRVVFISPARGPEFPFDLSRKDSMQRTRLKVHGVHLQIEDQLGPKDPLVLLHFGGSNLRMWDAAIPEFADRYRCITLDLRGHGCSDAPPTGYTIDDMARDVAGVIEQLEIAPSHILGSSIGAEVALSLAANHPTSVRSIVLDGAFHSEFGPYGFREESTPAEDEEVQARLKSLRDTEEPTFETREQAMQELIELYRRHKLWNDAMEAMIRYGIVGDEDGRLVGAWRKWAKDAYMHHYFEIRFEEYYRRLCCPAILLTGETRASDPSFYDNMEKLCALAENCQLIETPGAMHPFGWLLNPKPMVDAAKTFMDSIP